MYVLLPLEDLASGGVAHVSNTDALWCCTVLNSRVENAWGKRQHALPRGVSLVGCQLGKVNGDVSLQGIIFASHTLVLGEASPFLLPTAVD